MKNIGADRFQCSCKHCLKYQDSENVELRPKVKQMQQIIAQTVSYSMIGSRGDYDIYGVGTAQTIQCIMSEIGYNLKEKENKFIKKRKRIKKKMKKLHPGSNDCMQKLEFKKSEIDKKIAQLELKTKELPEKQESIGERIREEFRRCLMLVENEKDFENFFKIILSDHHASHGGKNFDLDWLILDIIKYFEDLTSETSSKEKMKFLLKQFQIFERMFPKSELEGISLEIKNEGDDITGSHLGIMVGANMRNRYYILKRFHEAYDQCNKKLNGGF